MQAIARPVIDGTTDRVFDGVEGFHKWYESKGSIGRRVDKNVYVRLRVGFVARVRSEQVQACDPESP